MAPTPDFSSLKQQAAKNLSLLEEIAAATEAKTNALATEATEQIRAINDMLQGIGVTYYDREIQDPSEHKSKLLTCSLSSAEKPKVFSNIGYARADGSFQLIVSETNFSNVDRPNTPLLNAPRQTRIDAIKDLPGFLDRFRKFAAEALQTDAAKLEQEAREVRATLADLKAITGGASQNETVSVAAEELPEGLRTSKFISAWRRWEQHRREIRHKLTPSIRRSHLAACAAWGPARAVAAIEHSIANGWRDIFEQK